MGVSVQRECCRCGNVYEARYYYRYGKICKFCKIAEQKKRESKGKPTEPKKSAKLLQLEIKLADIERKMQDATDDLQKYLSLRRERDLTLHSIEFEIQDKKDIVAYEYETRNLNS